MKKVFLFFSLIALCLTARSQFFENSTGGVALIRDLQKKAESVSKRTSLSRMPSQNLNTHNVLNNAGYDATAIRPQNIYLFSSVHNGKVVEVESGVFSYGKKVQQYNGYASNGPAADGRNQEWLIIPAGTRGGHRVYYIINNGFLKYLHMAESVSVETGRDADNQLWMINDTGAPNVYTIQSFLSRQFLQTPLNNTNNGVQMEMANFNGRANQQFKLIQYVGNTGPIGYVPGSSVNICPKMNNSKTINIANANTQNGAMIELHDIINGATNEHWRLFRTPDGYYKIHSAFTNKCIDVTGWEAGNNTNLVSWDHAEVEKQKWLIIPVAREPGYFIFFNKVSGKCIDVADASSANGAIVQTFTFANQDNQKWKLVPAR